jgi:1-deoxyxylulose-5-phosphate synthase
MQYGKFGSTGLEVSKLCLGCMTFGDAQRGTHVWTLKEEDSRPIIKQALELGINFFDTANVYSAGSSEEIVGRALKDFARREDVVLATKVWARMRPGPNGAGLSRKAIFAEIDASLTRLGTDYVDLYQIHRWDAGAPTEETLEALNDVVKAGKRYIGASNMPAWRFAKAIYTSRLNAWTQFVSMQDHLTLLYREEEREMLSTLGGASRRSRERRGGRCLRAWQSRLLPRAGRATGAGRRISCGPISCVGE